jgi:hypothetical protein
LHKARSKVTGEEYVCHSPALYRKKLDAGTSTFSCHACLPLHSGTLEPSPFIDEVQKLMACLAYWERESDDTYQHSTYFASVNLLTRMRHSFDSENGCDVCAWFGDSRCSSAMVELASVCEKYAATHGLDAPDFRFIGDNLHNALVQLGQVPS